MCDLCAAIRRVFPLSDEEITREDFDGLFAAAKAVEVLLPGPHQIGAGFTQESRHAQ